MVRRALSSCAPNTIERGGPCWLLKQRCMGTRVSSQQTNKNFGSNRNKPKKDLFWLCFGLFRETKNQNFWFVSVFFGVSNQYRNNRNKQNCFKTNRNNLKLLKNTKICSLSNCFGWSSVCFDSIETLTSLFWYRTEKIETNCFETNQNNPKQT